MGIPGRLSNVAVGFDGTVWGVNRYGHVYWKNGLKGGWKYIPTSNMRQISVGSKGRVFATARNDTIWTRVGVKGRWQNIPGRLRWIATNARNQVTGTNKYTRIYFALSGKGRKIIRKWSKRAVSHPKRKHKMHRTRKLTAFRKKLMKRKVSMRAVKRMAK